MTEAGPRFAPDLLARRTILITGASGGIGGAVAREAAALGARIIASGRDVDRLQGLVASLSGSGHRAEPMALSDADTVAEWVARVAQREQGLDAILHSAGVEMTRPVRMVRSAQIAEGLGCSVHAAFGLARASATKGVLRETGGSLVYMSSVAALRGQGGMAVYSAAKAAIDGLVRSAAMELAPRRIRVNSIAAGAVKTSMHDRLTGGLPEAAVAEYRSRHPLGFGEVEDIAAAAVFLLSDLSRWITGTTWVVDGGYTLR